MNSNESKQNSGDLAEELKQLGGTKNYHQYNKNILISDGVNFLLERTQCQWLVEIINSCIPAICDFGEPRVFIRMRVNFDEVSEGENPSADVVIDNGMVEMYWEDYEPGTKLEVDEDTLAHLIHKQHLSKTDFPLPEIILFFQFRGIEGGYPVWVLALLQEY